MLPAESMSNEKLRKITNNFQDVRLVGLSSWKAAAEFPGRDRGGPYVVMQEGYDPNDLRVTPDEFVLGRSGRWLSLSYFYRLPVPERRAEFLFATAAEVMQIMQNLAPNAEVMRPEGPAAAAVEGGGAAPGDEMAEALEAGRKATGGAAS